MNAKTGYEKLANLIVLIGALVLIFSIVIYFIESEAIRVDISLYGQFVGGVVGSLWSLAGITLFYAALKKQSHEFEVNRSQLELQREELILQREELKLQRHETELQRKEFERQTEQLMIQNTTLTNQKFESTFFELLALHNEIVRSNESRDLGKEWAKTLYLRFISTYQRRKNKEENELSLEEKMDLINISFNLFPKRPEYLDRYFSNLFFLINFVDKSKLDDKQFYINVIKSQLTIYEVILLYYFAITSLADQMLKKDIERYSFFSKIPKDELIENDHLNFYHSNAFLNNE